MIYNMKQIYSFLFFTILFSLPVFSQPSHIFIDAEKNYKDAKELFVKKQYALAYPLLQKLHEKQEDNQQSNNYYLQEDVNY